MWRIAIVAFVFIQTFSPSNSFSLFSASNEHGKNVSGENPVEVKSRRGIPGVDISALDETYQKAEKMLRIHEADLAADPSLESWEAPLVIQESFPYYLSGYDDFLRPIWVAQFGEMDFRKIIGKKDQQLLHEFERYVKQAAFRIWKSLEKSQSEGQSVMEYIFIFDCDELKMKQVAYLPTLRLIIKLAYMYKDLMNKYMGPAVFINANWLAEAVIKLIKPAFGPTFSRIQVYGKDENSKYNSLLKQTDYRTNGLDKLK